MHTHIVLSNNNIQEYFYYGVCTLRAVYEYYVLLVVNHLQEPSFYEVEQKENNYIVAFAL